MSELSVKIDQELIKGLKEKDHITVDTLRMVKVSIKNREIELGKDLEEEEILRVLRAEIKSRKEAIDKFEQAGRNDLSQKEEKEIKIIKEFLPDDLSLAELENIAEKVIKETKAKSKADLGKVMPLVIKAVRGRASGEKIKNLVVKLLG